MKMKSQYDRRLIHLNYLEATRGSLSNVSFYFANLSQIYWFVIRSARVYLVGFEIIKNADSSCSKCYDTSFL